MGDVLIFDYPGTREGTGVPSEASYYEGVDAMLGVLLELGYHYNQIIVTGFCLGSAVATYLKQRYHQEGLHLVLEHSPPSAQSIIDNQNWLARRLGLAGLSGLRNPDTEMLQDGFNTLSKLENLEGRSNGVVVVVSTSTDLIVPPATIQTLIEAATPYATVRHIVRNGEETPGAGHDDLPLKDLQTWRAYKAIIRENIQPASAASSSSSSTS